MSLFHALLLAVVASNRRLPVPSEPRKPKALQNWSQNAHQGRPPRPSLFTNQPLLLSVAALSHARPRTSQCLLQGPHRRSRHIRLRSSGRILLSWLRGFLRLPQLVPPPSSAHLSRSRSLHPLSLPPLPLLPPDQRQWLRLGAKLRRTTPCGASSGTLFGATRRRSRTSRFCPSRSRSRPSRRPRRCLLCRRSRCRSCCRRSTSLPSTRSCTHRTRMMASPSTLALGSL
mmetsp:Transcript_1380/g.3032  ORF Transcript_1380/g.3032 Transcript_1380/m.3032 type:complete len:229 (-) Transcript_1380:453-1139(-)